MDIDDVTLATIDRVAKRLAPKFTFGYYDVEDIEQEARLIGMEGLKKYDGVRPLENFLTIHIHNRLVNFKRDNFCRPEKPKSKLWEKKIQRKISLLQPVSIDGLEEHFANRESLVDSVTYLELIEKIDRELPPSLRTDFLRLMAKVPIPPSRKVKVQTKILEILNDQRENDEGEQEEIED